MTNYGPCEAWDPVWTCDVSAQSPTATGRAAMAATEIVWALSGRQFGTCEVTLRPCRRSCYDGLWWARYGEPWSVSYPTSPWFDLSCGTCMSSCSCTSLSEVDLPSPVSEIITVKIDGVVVTGTYRLDNDHLLVRTDGLSWPVCNDLSKNDDQPGTWSITVAYGQSVPVSGQLAVGELACEILKALAGEDCRLPAGITGLIRQGVSISYPDVGELLREGRTGLYLVDSFLAWSNPNQLASRSRVMSVDRPPHRRTAT